LRILENKSMTAEAEAKQLDSVTDVVKEAEIDTAKAQEAIGLITAKKENDHKSAALAAVTVSKEDVALIVSELEVTEDVAERVLREVSLEAKEGNVVEAALRTLIA
jgi:NACalpha-BTF3-like transcription factor